MSWFRTTDHARQRLRDRLPWTAEMSFEHVCRTMYSMWNRGVDFGGQLGRSEARLVLCPRSGIELVFCVVLQTDGVRVCKTVLTLDQAIANNQMWARL